MANLEDQIFPESKNDIKPITTIHAEHSEPRKLEGNIRVQIQKLESSTLQNNAATELQHLFKMKVPTPQQVYDLLNFRKLGESEYKRQIDYFILRSPSVKPPKHRKSLLTFSEKKTRQKKSSAIEKKRRLQIECWKKRVAYATSTGMQASTAYEQCLELPRALANPELRTAKQRNQV